VRDLLAWYRADSQDWEKTWQLCQKKYRENPAYQKASNGGIDCKINGAYVLLGLLYGHGDPDRTIAIAMRGGQDSDCNPSSAAGVLFITMGFAKVPERFTRDLSQTTIFSHTAYSFPGLMAVCEKLARQIVQNAGGQVNRENGEEVVLIPVRAPQPSKLELSWAPGPIADSRFTPAEMAKIKADKVPAQVLDAVEKFAPGWQIANCGEDMDPGLRAEWGGRKNVLVTHPLDENAGCVLTKKVRVPAGKKTKLRLVLAHDPQGDFDLIVRANGQQLLRKPVSKATATDDPWLVQEVDLSPLAGEKPVKLELVNQPSGWSFEAAYWAEIAVVTE
jgi:hypothetical protein